jgi:hypothetical protein
MSIWIRYTKYEFTQPKQISLTEYNQLKDNYIGYLDKVITPGKETFLKDYKFKIFLGSIVLLLCFLTLQQAMKFGFVIVYILLAIIGIKCFGYIFSALSIWDNIQNKKRFYMKLKALIDKSTDYIDFQQLFASWNKEKDLGFIGRLTYQILVRLHRNSA